MSGPEETSRVSALGYALWGASDIRVRQPLSAKRRIRRASDYPKIARNRGPDFKSHLSLLCSRAAQDGSGEEIQWTAAPI